MEILADRFVAERGQIVADVAHEERRTPTVAAPSRDAEHGVIDGVRARSISPASHTRAAGIRGRRRRAS